MSEKLFRANRISADRYQKLVSVLGSLEGTVLEPLFTFRKANASENIDLSIDVKEKQSRLEDLQKEVLELSQERTILALDEQKVNTARSNALQELTGLRRKCDELVLMKEKLEHEMPELEAVTAFWSDRNTKSETALKTALGRLESLQQEKDAQSFQMLQELHSMYTTLDEASRFLNKDKKTEEESS
jgi:chromosome segregation ATPase